jgi:hypothetical protein
MMDEARLKEKLRLIEALFAGAKTAGEKDAADRARQRILERLRSLGASDPPIAFKFTLRDMWQRKVMVALMRRYGLKPYRYRGQRYTTVMQFTFGRRHIGNVSEGELVRYPAWDSMGLPN